MLNGKIFKLSPFSITLIYLIIAALWIVFSDQLLILFVKDEYLVTQLQTAKGLIYVCCTAGILYLLMKVASKNIRENAQRLYREQMWLTRFTESSPSGVIFINREGRFSYANQKALNMFELSEEEFYKREISEYDWQLRDFQDEEIPSGQLPFQLVVNSGESVLDYQHKIITPSGKERFISVNAAPITDQQNELEGVVLTLNDITDNIRAEERLKEEESRYRTLVEYSPFAIGIHQRGEIVFANKEAVRMMEARSSDELLGLDLFDIVAPDHVEESRERLQKMLDGDSSVYPAEVEYITRKGNKVPVEALVAPITYQGEPAIQVIAMDISEKVDREKQLTNALEEQRLLLGEMHHRVKNNMAVISGLMQLQSFNTEKEELRKELDMAVRRVKSIAIVHENLYENSTLKHIPLHEHLNKIVEPLQHKRPPVNLTADTDEVYVNVNQAVPCALFLNEIISSTLNDEHHGAGFFRLLLNKDDDMICLRVQTDIISDLFRKSGDGGKELISLIAAQLDATLNVSVGEEKGEVVLRFDPSEKTSGSHGSQFFDGR